MIVYEALDSQTNTQVVVNYNQLSLLYTIIVIQNDKIKYKNLPVVVVPNEAVDEDTVNTFKLIALDLIEENT